MSLTSCREAQATGIWAYDCVLNDIVLVIIWVLAMLGDNLMQSEFACHAGLRAKSFCRMCWVKGHDSADNRDDLGGDALEGSSRKETLKTMIACIKCFMEVNSLIWHCYTIDSMHSTGWQAKRIGDPKSLKRHLIQCFYVGASSSK